MAEDNLKVSIITICLNSEDLIEKTIKSVISQTYLNTEYIVVDGKSTDNTINIISQYMSNIDIFVSEEDGGIYYAMNKGLKLATGDIIHFLNSGDYFYDRNVLETIVKKFVENDDIDIIYGNFIYYGENTNQLFISKCQNNLEVIAKGINHQSIFTRKKVFEECGFFDTVYELYGDYDWLIRSLIKYNKKIMYMDIPVVYFLEGGFCNKYCRKFGDERFDISTKYLSIGMFLKYAVSFKNILKRDLKIKILKNLKLRYY